MNRREALSWSFIARSLTDEPPCSVWDWNDLAEAIDYLNGRAYKSFKESGHDKFAQAITMLPNWTVERVEELLRARVP